MRPRIIALLSWWEESPAWLTRCVTGVGRFADHLVAVDGAYAHMQGSLDYFRSGHEQVEAIAAAAAGCGMSYTIHVPHQPWRGDEVGKRTFMFDAGMLAARDDDWFFVIDSDEMVTKAPTDLHDQLERTDCETATVEWVERTADQPIPGDDYQLDRLYENLTIRSVQVQGVRKFFRADPTLRVESAHYVYVAGHDDEKRYLWGNSSVHDLEPAAHIDGLRFEHWHRYRQPARKKIGEQYYCLRDDLSLETLRPAHLDGIPEVERV